MFKRKPFFCFVLLLQGLSTAFGQINAYYASSQFNTPSGKPYLETWITISDHALAHRKSAAGNQHVVGVDVVLRRDTVIMLQERYNIVSPAFTGSFCPAPFTDSHRYPVADGRYTLEIRLHDNLSSGRKPLTIREDINIRFPADSIAFSTIQPVESYSRVAKPGPLTKSGYDLMPFNSDFYPETVSQLAFYVEGYNTANVLGISKPFLFRYIIRNAVTRDTMPGYAAFSKQKTAAVNPLLAKLDISKLRSGSYELLVEIVDETNTRRGSTSYNFERANRTHDRLNPADRNEARIYAEYFGRCSNADTLLMYVESLWPIANGLDKERVINHSIMRNPDKMKHFVVDFWERRAADTANPLQMWATHYQRLQQVLQLFKCGKQKGYYTDRGRVYMQYGAPSQRSQQPMEPNTYPYEIWHYYRTTDEATGRVFSNRKFVFASRNLGDDCHKLIHSDMPGELSNPRWRYEISRQNPTGIGNPDNESPSGTQYNQFNEIYNSPR